MSSKRVQEVIDKFVDELVAAAEQDALDSVRDRIRDSLGINIGLLVSSQASKRRKSTRRFSMARPCPIPGCDDIAYPRHGMVCKKHNAELSREDILVARDNANKPGGIWSNWKAGKKAS